MEQSELQIFLSYASQDQERVLPVYEFLVRNGFPNAWIDCKKLLPGHPWEYEIQKNLRKSDIIIIFLSNISVNKRGFVQKELKIALRYLEEKLSNDTYIIPVKLDSDVQVPDDLAKFQCLDINSTSALSLLRQSLEAQTQKLGFEISQESEHLDQIHVTKKLFKEVWDGLPGYEIEFAIPVFHSTKFENISEITKIIEASFIKRLHVYRANKLEQLPKVYSWASESYSRTNTFDAHYGTVHHKNYYLGIQYAAHWYFAGAAHPNFHFETFNFLLNPLIEIIDLKSVFAYPDRDFKDFVNIVRQHIVDASDEKINYNNDTEDGLVLDTEQVENGTSNWESLNSFTFSDVGLELYFAPYQIAGYAAGPHFATIPYKAIGKYLRKDIKHALGINYLLID